MNYELSEEDIKKLDIIKVVCNQVELHELMDLFEDGEIPQPIMTKESENKYIIYLNNELYESNSVLEILERKLDRKSYKI